MASNKQLNEDFNKMLDILNNPVKKKLRAEFRRVQKKALSMYLDSRLIEDSIYTEHRNNLTQIAFDGFMRSQKMGARRQLNIFKNDKVIKSNQIKKIYDSISLDFQNFALVQSEESAVSMAKTSRDAIEWLIDKYTKIDIKKETNGILDIIKDARKEALERSIWRSFIGGLAIVHGGANKGAFDSASGTEKETGFEFRKVWVTKQDNKVRDTHRPMHGKSIKRDELFEVPTNSNGLFSTEFMRYPGDRRASIGNWINCRCSLSLRKVKNEG